LLFGDYDMNLIQKGVLALAAGATALTVASPAEAQSRYRYRSHDDAGTAIVAGIAGLAIGAAIAGSSRGYYNDPYYYNNGYNSYPYYYNQGYYNQGYYGYPQYQGYYGYPQYYSQPRVAIQLGSRYGSSRYYRRRYR
jgi:hypothetical protein